MEIIEKWKQLYDSWEKDYKNKKIKKLTSAIILFGIGAVTMTLTFVFFANSKSNLVGCVFCFGSIFFIVGIVLFISGFSTGFLYKEYNRLKDLNYELLAKEYDCSSTNIQYEVENVLQGHYNIEADWYKDEHKFYTVYELLGKKLKKNIREEQKDDLQVENLKLQNEGLEIDNSLKKPWVCEYCENMNAGGEMSCIKCGAVRRQ